MSSMTYALIILGFVLLGSFAYAAASGAPWVPTRKGDVTRVARLLDLKAGERAVELGCGNGRVCRGLAQQAEDTEVVGVELSLVQYVIAVLQARLSGSRAQFKFQNAFKHDLSDYDGVYLFLMPETYAKIQPKLEQELKPGARVVSYVWPIPGWKPTMVDKQEGELDLYLYTIVKQ
jgi:SAM-dependent methyltransferase